MTQQQKKMPQQEFGLWAWTELYIDWNTWPVQLGTCWTEVELILEA